MKHACVGQGWYGAVHGTGDDIVQGSSRRISLPVHPASSSAPACVLPLEPIPASLISEYFSLHWLVQCECLPLQAFSSTWDHT